MISVRYHYMQQLDALHAELRALGQLTIAAITWSLGAFSNNDINLAKRIITDDQVIDQAHYTLEEHAISVIATQQPVAGDLRRLLATIAVASEFERIGDYAKGIAKLVVRAVEQPSLETPDALFQMSDRAIAMLNESLEAFIHQDIEAARRLGVEDDQVDTLQKQIRSDILQRMQQEPQHAIQLVSLLSLTHNIERIADRSTNIAERVVFMVSGTQVELNP